MNDRFPVNQDPIALTSKEEEALATAVGSVEDRLRGHPYWMGKREETGVWTAHPKVRSELVRQSSPLVAKRLVEFAREGEIQNFISAIDNNAPLLLKKDIPSEVISFTASEEVANEIKKNIISRFKKSAEISLAESDNNPFSINAFSVLERYIDLGLVNPDIAKDTQIQSLLMAYLHEQAKPLGDLGYAMFYGKGKRDSITKIIKRAVKIGILESHKKTITAIDEELKKT